MNDAWNMAHANFLSSLSQTELTSLLDTAARRTFAKGASIFEAGGASSEVYIAATGCIALCQLSPGGKEVILSFVFPGEVFGLAEGMRKAPREVSAVAKVPSDVLVFRQKEFLGFLSANPQAALRTIGILSARLRTLGSTLVDLASDNAEMRIVRLLMRFTAGSLPPPCDAMRRAGEICVNVDLTRTDVANLMGTSRQTVTTLFARLQRHRIIRPVGRHLHIIDPLQLGRLYEQETFQT